MVNLLIASALMGLVLGRLFRVYVLIPASVFAVILACTDPGMLAYSLSEACLTVGAIVVSVQLGYFVSLAAGRMPALLPNRRSSLWASLP